MFGRKHNATRIQFSYSWPWAVAGGTRGAQHLRTLICLWESRQGWLRFGRAPASFIPWTTENDIDPRSSALLVKDYQVDTLTRFMTAAQSADAIAYVPDLSPWRETRA